MISIPPVSIGSDNIFQDTWFLDQLRRAILELQNNLKEQAAAAQAAVTLGNTNNEIGGLTISVGYSQAEVQALRDKCEELADDVRNLSTLVHALRTALINANIIKGSA